VLRFNSVVAADLFLCFTPQFFCVDSRRRGEFLRKRLLGFSFETVKIFSRNLEWIRKGLTDPLESL
jgi:hypothetical protein